MFSARQEKYWKRFSLKSSSKVIAGKLIVTLDHVHCYEVNATAFEW